MYLNAILKFTSYNNKLFQSRISKIEENKMSTLEEPVAAGAGPSDEELYIQLEIEFEQIRRDVKWRQIYIEQWGSKVDAGVSGAFVAMNYRTYERDLAVLCKKAKSTYQRMKSLNEKISPKRQQDRCKKLKEEIIAAAFRPRKVEKLSVVNDI